MAARACLILRAQGGMAGKTRRYASSGKQKGRAKRVLFARP
jgi:hypothetical protein